MKKRKIRDELSAHLDGESEHPDEIARLTQRDAEAARRYMQWAKLSSHMKAMQAPEVGPEFAARVLQEVEQAKPVRPVWLAFGLPALAAAVVLVLAGLAWFRHLPEQSVQPIRTGRVENATSATPEQALLAEIERRVASGEEFVPEQHLPFLPVVEGGWDEAEDLTDFVFASVASGEWPEETAQFAGSWPEELDMVVSEIDDSEGQAFRELLRAYAEEEWTI